MPKKHGNLDITFRLKYIWCLTQKFRLNSSRRPTVCNRCSDANLLFYFTITMHRDIKKSLTIT